MALGRIVVGCAVLCWWCVGVVCVYACGVVRGVCMYMWCCVGGVLVLCVYACGVVRGCCVVVVCCCC